MTDIKIEIADKSDLEQILSLQKEAYLSEAEIYQDYSLPPLKQTLKEIEEEFNNQVFMRVRSGGVLIGSVRAFEKERVCYIGRLIVQPSYQNMGLGSKLLSGIEACFPKATRFELFTGDRSKKNLHLYKKMGYETFRQQKVSDGLTLIFLYKNNKLA